MTKCEHVGVGTGLRAGQSGVRILLAKRDFSVFFKRSDQLWGPPPAQLVLGFFPRIKYEHVGVGTRLRAGQPGVRIVLAKRDFSVFF